LSTGDPSLEPLVDKIRKNFAVERIVLGHTYADAAITPRFGGKVILIDIGLSRVYDGIGKVGCLVIEGSQVYVLHRGTRLELPSDTGKDLLRYLKQAAALDPPPSPLQKRIAELQGSIPAEWAPDRCKRLCFLSVCPQRHPVSACWISAKYASMKIREINEKVRKDLEGDPAKPTTVLRWCNPILRHSVYPSGSAKHI
jgi:hypothetical protein